MSSLNLSIHYIKKKELAFLIAITNIRYRLGYSIRCESEWNEYFPTTNESRLSEAVTTIIFNHHIISNEEVKFFTINMLTRSCIYEVQPLRNELLNFIQKDSIVYTATQKFITEFSKKIAKIPHEQYEDIFIFAFRSHLFVHLYDHMDFDYNSNYLLDNIYKKFPKYHKEMSIFINYLFEQTTASLFLESNYLTQIYFMIESVVKPEFLLGKTVRILLETDLPELYENSIKKRLYDYFKYDYELVFVNNQGLQQADIILSTIVNTTRSGKVIHFYFPIESKDLRHIDKNLKIFIKK